MLPPIRIPRHRNPKPHLPEPTKPSFAEDGSGEVLSGTVQNLKASAAEERAARSLHKNKVVDAFEFRKTINAPRNMPGFKELDYLVASRGTMYAFEIDSPFTHRTKARADVLHDAIVLRSLEQDGYQVYPTVFHVQGETDLVDQKTSDNYFMGIFQ